ncbi:hypothetical protein [Erysipelothrix rhusiopathiae]|uniref:hypothetical protein n=1 Tax=Erysipelothrix rhusiopathiae TaxID=1648 RepID=UPI002B242186|nr:hypothetical protein [Erysipelothrix rhusiopathiae]WRB93680.1 hypothetical protein LL063_03585 [Erysipelothrix rhusiopathiae]
MREIRETLEFQQLDRILGIIYKELNYESLILEDKDSDEFRSLFSINSVSNFTDLVINKYMELYPNNYNEDSISNILQFFNNQIEREYGNSNTASLIFYVSCNILRERNDTLEVSYDDLLEWDGFINKLNPDVFISAFFAERKIKMEFHSVKNDNKEIDFILAQGIADNHMHLKASGYTVEMNWYHFCESSLYSKRIDDFSKNSHVFRNQLKGNHSKEKNTLMLYKCKLLRMYLEHVVIGKDDNWLSQNEIYKLLQSNEKANFLAVSNLIFKYSNNEKHTSPELLDMKRLKKYYQNERDLLLTLFKLFSDGQLNHFDVVMMNLYILMSNQIKFMFVQDNVGMGFTKFKHHEDIKENFIPEGLASRDLIRTVFKKYYLEKHVRSIEVRIAPKNSVRAYNKFANDLNRINDEVYENLKLKYHDLIKIKVTIVVHFIKVQHEEINSNYPRFNNLRDDIQKKMTIFERFLESTNDSDLLDSRSMYTGIDAANYEINCPPEIFAPAFRKLKCNREIHKIYQTYHVGEEFSTLLSGLRAIDETLEFLEYRPNDRLGHALALGIDVENHFIKQRRQIHQTVQQYTDDIVWAYNKIDCGNYRLKQYLYEKFSFIISTYYISNTKTKYYAQYSIHEFYLAWILRGCDPYEVLSIHNNKKIDEQSHKLNYSATDFSEAINNPNARQIYINYHFNEEIRKLNSIVFMSYIDEFYIEIIKNVQELLFEKIEKLRVFIEANPTSNRKIASIDKYSELPLLKLMPIDNRKISISNSINTDDSSIFQTNLSNEYSMIAASLSREGYNSKIYTIT